MSNPVAPNPTPVAHLASASLGERLRYLPHYLLPQRLLTALTYRVTRVRIPWFKDALIRGFSRHFRVDLSEALEPNPRAYADFNAFFTRPLRPDARPLTSGERALCCPVDGAVSQAGTAAADTLLQAKGRLFSLTALLGGDGQHPRTTMNLCTPGTHVVMGGELVTKHIVKSSAPTFPAEEWVRAEVEVRGHDEIIHRVNGVEVLRYQNPQLDPANNNAPATDQIEAGGNVKLGYGHIALQAEGQPVWFRKIELRSLEPK